MGNPVLDFAQLVPLCTLGKKKKKKKLALPQDTAICQEIVIINIQIQMTMIINGVPKVYSA